LRIAPLVEALQRHVTMGAKLHADNTPLPMLPPGLGKTTTARLWTYVRDDRPAGSADPNLASTTTSHTTAKANRKVRRMMQARPREPT
jgi:hypothetical protein